jgi:hypothetical protein
MATVYVAGKYWDDNQAFAVAYGFGLIQENGTDMNVEDPRRKPEVQKEVENIAADYRGARGGGDHGVMVGKKKGKKNLKGKEPLS